MKINVLSIKNALQTQRDTLQNTYHVANLGIFGSVARGDHTDASDIDVLVTFTKPVSLFKFLALEAHLTTLLGKKVDLVTKKALKPAIRNDILKEVMYV